jgi:hypothetical protein
MNTAALAAAAARWACALRGGTFALELWIRCAEFRGRCRVPIDAGSAAHDRTERGAKLHETSIKLPTALRTALLFGNLGYLGNH